MGQKFGPCADWMFSMYSREAGACSPSRKATCCQSVSHRRRGFLNCYYAPLNHFQNIKQSDLIISRGSRTNRPLTNTQPTQFAETHGHARPHTHTQTLTPLLPRYLNTPMHTQRAPESAVSRKTTEQRLSARSHQESDPLQI